MDFFKNLKPDDICIELQNINIEEDTSRNEEVYIDWINSVLQSCGSNYRVKNLYNDLKSGIILSHIIYAFTGVKLKLSSESYLNNKPIMLINLLIVTQTLENNGLLLVHNNIIDIYDGNRRIILGLVWQMILHFGIIDENNQNYYKLPSSPASKLSLSVTKNNFIELSQENTKVASAIVGSVNYLIEIEAIVKNIIKSGQCNQIILNWLEKKLLKPYGIKITNFSSDWKDGIALMALIDSFYPKLVNMKYVEGNSPKVNLSLAFKYASKYLGIKNNLKLESVLSECPDEGLIAFYICQFIRIDLKKGKINRIPSTIKDDTGEQFFPQEFQLLINDEVKDILMDKCSESLNESVNKNSYDCQDKYQTECIRNSSKNHSLPLLSDDNFLQNNNLLSVDSLFECHLSSLKDTFSYISDNMILQEDEKSINLLNEISSTYSIEECPLSFKLEVENRNDNDDSMIDNISKNNDTMKHSINKGSSSSKEDAFNNSYKKTSTHQKIFDLPSSYSNVDDDKNIVNETDDEEFEEKCLNDNIKNENISKSVEKNKCIMGDNSLNSVVINSCVVILVEEISNLCLMPLSSLLFKKIYEIMNVGERGDNVYSISKETEHLKKNTPQISFDKLETYENQEDQINFIVRNIVLDIIKTPNDSIAYSNLDNEEKNQKTSSQYSKKSIEESIKKLFYTVINVSPLDTKIPQLVKKKF
uniref:Calponin-homology (CH) domain-containing protein n=1 Tax=Strongyloides stercoralis TaxID=6248 RepID=A0A0K0E383_STRER